MSELRQLERLVASGNQANIEMVRQMVMSPRLHKARGILKRCGMRVFPPQEAGQGLWNFIKHNTSATPCNCQARVTCKICERTVCKTHFRFDVMECTACGGDDAHYYTAMRITAKMLERVDLKFREARLHMALRDEAGQSGNWMDDYMKVWEKCKNDPTCQGVSFIKKRRSGQQYAMELANSIIPRPSKKAKTREEKPKQKNRYGFLDGLKPHGRR